MWSIIVHGGAGNVPKSLEARQRQGCEQATEVGARILAAGGSAVDAAVAAVRALEDSPFYNAGIGAALDENGLPALDAAVMRGRDLAYGAVAAVVGSKNPIDLARRIMEDGRHCLIAGPAALELARRWGLPTVDPETHKTDKTRREWAERRAQIQSQGAPPPTAEWSPIDKDGESRGNTVGAVARDGSGSLAAATSTGGLLFRYAGRVGDSPIAGAGTYARDDLGAASATGHGETMLRTVFCFQALLSVQSSHTDDPSAVLLRVLDEAKARCGGTGGVILALPSGQLAHARNTPAMACAWRQDGHAVGSAF